MGNLKSTNKNELRTFYKNIRKNLSLKRRNEAADKLLNYIYLLPSKSIVMSFVSLSTEIDTSLVNNFLLEHHTLLLPSISKGRIVPYLISSLSEMLSSTPQHIKGTVFSLQKHNPITHVLVPGLVFDNQNHRIGFGGGFYDRWLSENISVFSIGIGFHEQLVKQLPISPHDKPVSQLLLF